MKVAVGSPGTWSGMLLRVGQSAFGFSNYTAYCYLIASMGLQIVWSFGLLYLDDIHAVKFKRNLHNHMLISLFVIGDWLTATLSLAAACMLFGRCEFCS